MIEVASIYGFPIWVCILPDADFNTYGYYYEIYMDEDGSKRIDYGNTYDKDYCNSLEYACGIAERLEF
jgi:hypothetical protein